MDYDRDQLVEMLVSLGKHEEATRAQAELPDLVDPVEHAVLLERLGVTPSELVGSLDALGGLASDAGEPSEPASDGESAGAEVEAGADLPSATS